MINNKKLKWFTILIFIIILYLFVAIFFKSVFYINIYDADTKEYVDMSYTDINTSFNAVCTGTPGTGQSGYYMYQPQIALPGFITVNVEGYEVKRKFTFLGFNNEIDLYLKKDR